MHALVTLILAIAAGVTAGTIGGRLYDRAESRIRRARAGRRSATFYKQFKKDA